MATATIQVKTAFTPTNNTQANVATPADVPTLSNTTATGVSQQYVTLAAAGTSYTLSVPSTWTQVDTIHIENIDTTGYCVLTVNATTGAPVFQLAPAGGTFACSFGASVPAGTVAANPASTWILKSCNSAGVTASGTATLVYVYMAGH